MLRFAPVTGSARFVFVGVGRTGTLDADETGAVALARPKSRSLNPVLIR
jgi:hypothetical protein